MTESRLEESAELEESYARARNAIERARATPTASEPEIALRLVSSLFSASVRLFEAADQTEWHPDRKHYRVFASATADLAAAAAEFTAEDEFLESAEASARARDASWKTDLRPRREWTRRVRAEAMGLADALTEAPGEIGRLRERLHEIVTLCIEMMVWLEGRGRTSRAPLNQRS